MQNLVRGSIWLLLGGLFVTAQAQSPGDGVDKMPMSPKQKITPVASKVQLTFTPLTLTDLAPIILTLGDVHTLPLVGKIRRIALGNGSFVSATTIDTSLLLIAEQVGRTKLMVWTDRSVYSFSVQVVHPDLAGARRMLDVVVRRNPGLEIGEIDTKLVVSGVAHKPAIAQLAAIARDLPGVLLNVTEDEGSAPVQSVLFKLHFIEVKKSFIESVGIKWDKEIRGPVIGAQGSRQSGLFRGGGGPASPGDNLLDPDRGFNTVNGRTSGFFLGLATTLASRINLGVSDGDARILASPELSAKSGGKARLQVGGEVPIPIAGAFGSTTVEFKPYGIIFAIEPFVDVNGVVTAKLSTELSQIDPAVSVQGIPGFLTRATSTEISLQSGEMFALSGLLSGELSNAIDKVPGLGNVPILGRLFSSDDYRNQRTDLVVLVEPQIINVTSLGAEELKRRGLKNIEDFRETSSMHEGSGGRQPLSRKPTLPVSSPKPFSENY